MLLRLQSVSQSATGLANTQRAEPHSQQFPPHLENCCFQLSVCLSGVGITEHWVDSAPVCGTDTQHPWPLPSDCLHCFLVNVRDNQTDLHTCPTCRRRITAHCLFAYGRCFQAKMPIFQCLGCRFPIPACAVSLSCLLPPETPSQPTPRSFLHFICLS